MITREDAGNLAYRHAALQPAKDATDVIDVGLGIQAVATVGAGWLDQAMAALPGAQGHSIDASQAGNLTDWKQVLLRQARID